jgi:undecaprenyl-diphosphatase
VSRSGGTVSAGLLLGYTRADATEHAFLLAIPAVFGSGLYKLTDIGKDGQTASGVRRSSRR